jgi:hypothetical protein
MASTAPASTSPATPLPGTLTVLPVNANVYSVHLADGTHVGNLKRVGAVWKFKAVGYDTAGAVEPGGGPLTDQHNMVFAQPDAAEVSARLLENRAPRGLSST